MVQRVSRCVVSVEGRDLSSTGAGLLVYLGIASEDTHAETQYVTQKVLDLRVFPDDTGKMNLCVRDVRGEIMVVSQFTLYGDARRGRRPSYTLAAPPEIARPLYEQFLDRIRSSGLVVGSGEFQSIMEVDSINHGPVTILLDSSRAF